MKWVAKANHIPEIATMAAGLAKILRTSISKRQFIYLKEELELVNCYVDIPVSYTHLDVYKRQVERRSRWITGGDSCTMCTQNCGDACGEHEPGKRKPVQAG